MGSVEYRFALGADAPRPEGAAYMRLEREGTFVVDRALTAQLRRPADAYRDRTLVSYGASGVGRVDVRASSGSSFAIERHGATFRIAGQGKRASRAAVDRLMMALAEVRAESFLDDATADAATRAPVFVVEIGPRDASHAAIELRVGGDCPDHAGEVVVVRTQPGRVSGCTSWSLVDALGAAPGALADLSALSTRADEIEELRIEPADRAGPRVDVARRGSGWRERSPEARDLTSDESESTNALALALAEARGTEALPPGAADRVEVRARVTVVRTGGGATEVVELGSAPGEPRVLRRTDDGVALRVTQDVARRFEPHPVALRGGAIWTTAFDPAAVVAVDDTCGPTAQRLELRARSWAFRAPAGLAVDPGSVAELLGALTHAKADAWIAEGDDGSFGFDGPGACAVSLTLEGDSSGDAGPRRVSLTLTFGAAGDRGVYARTSDERSVFVAPSALREELAHPAIDRSRFQLDAERTASASLVYDGVRRELSAKGDGSDALAIALASLYARAAVHAGPAGRDEGMAHPTLEIVARGAADSGLGETHIAIGAATEVDGVPSYFARVSGVDATFLVPEARVEAILKEL
jgi:hypothetical protein